MTRRRAKRLALRVLRSMGGFRVARWMTRKYVRILCFHGVWLGDARFSGDALFMRPVTFRRRLALLRKLDYPLATLRDAVAGLAGRAPLAPCTVVVTIDDAWLGTAIEMWPTLRAAGIPATLYVDTANLLADAAVEHVERRYVARYGDHVRDSGTCTYMSGAQLRAAYAEGLDVQLHTHTHSMHRFEPEAVLEEIERNREALALVLGEPPETFRHLAYPSGRCAPALKQVLASAGVHSATTVERALARPGDDPHFLPRLLDSECDSEIEFEAELAGVFDMLRRIKRRIVRLWQSRVRDRGGAGDAGERRRRGQAGTSVRAGGRPAGA